MENIQRQNQNRIEKKPGIFNKVFSIFGFGDKNQNRTNEQVPIANDKTMWIPDEKAQTCYNCRKEFSAFFLRKHHCRICGNVFCKECSSKTVEGKYWGSKKEIKVCDYCFEMYQKLDETLIENDNPNNLTDDIYTIYDNMKNIKRETKLSEYCKKSKKYLEECVQFLQMERKLEEPIKVNLENYFDFLLRQIIDNVFKIEGINEKWVDKIFEITKKAINQVNPSFRDLKDYLNINEYMKIKTICHKDNSLCKVIDGFAFQKNVCTKNMNTNIENPKILLLDCGLDYSRNNDITDFENLKLQEPAYFNIIMKKIELVEPNVILVNKNISRKIQESLSKLVSLVINVKSSSLKRIARCTKTYVLPSTDLIDKQFILGTCKKFRVEKVKFSQNNNTKTFSNNIILNANSDCIDEEKNKFRSENISHKNLLYKLDDINNPAATNNKNINNFNFQDAKENNKLLETLNMNKKLNTYDNLKSNEYNLMIFEGCDNLLFCTIILYGPDKTELKKLKKTLRTILLTARDLFLQQNLLYFFYSDLKNINEACHHANNISFENEMSLINNLNSFQNNNDLSLQSSLSTIPIQGKESIQNNTKYIHQSNLTPTFDMNNNVNLTNIFSCLSKLELEYKQLAKDFFFGFDRSLLEDKSKLSVVRLIITQGTYSNPAILYDKSNLFNNILPSILFEQNLVSENFNTNNLNENHKPPIKTSVFNFNNELPEKEILESINSICDEPEELDLIYYSKDNDYDKPLGKLILDLCAESDSKCDICKKPKNTHFYYIYKKTGRLKIQLGQNQDDFAEKIMESINRETTDFNKINNYSKSEKEKSIYLNSISNYNIDIFSYGVCKICKKVVTPLIKLTREIFNFSVAKFFKFMLFNHLVKNRSDIKSEFNLKKHYIAENNCSHYLNKDISRIFISKLGTIKFSYENCPLYIIETSPIHELKNKDHYKIILEEYIIDSKKKSMELIDILKNNFFVFMDELNSEFYKGSISLLNNSNNANPNLNNNNSNNTQTNTANIINSNSNANNNEKKEIKDYTEKTLKICQKYYNVLVDINTFIDLVFLPIKFKNYLKSVSIVKKIYFRIVQIKIIQDRCWMMIRRIKRFINNHLDNKVNKVINTPNLNSGNNNINPNPTTPNNIEINDNISVMSPEQKSTFSSGIKENNNLSKDYISQLNQGVIQNLNNANNITPLTLETNTNPANISIINHKTNTCSINVLNSNNIPIHEQNVSKSILNLEENLNLNLLDKLNTKINKQNAICKENQSVIESAIAPSLNHQISSTLINMDDDNISKVNKPMNVINIETKDSFKHVLRNINFFDETNHKFFSTDISFNDIASIISYTLTSDKYREYISPSNRLRLLDIKCKRQKKLKDFKDGLNQQNPNGPIFNRINNVNDNSDKNENKYGYSFLNSPDMEVYDTSLLFDQNKNNYSYQNLEKSKIYQQLETELLSDDKSQFNYSFTNSNLINLLSSLNMTVEYVNSNNSTSGNSFYKKSKNTSKSLLNSLSLNLNKNTNIINEKENSSMINNNNPNISHSMIHDLNNSVLNNPISRDTLQNNFNNNTTVTSSSNILNPQSKNINEIEISNNNQINQNNYIINKNNNYSSSIIHSGNQYMPEEKVLLSGDNIKFTMEELEMMKKDIKAYKNQNIPNVDTKTKTKKKKFDTQESNSQMDIDVCVYYPRQFEALRITYCATYNDFILSVSNFLIIFS